jgi:hypothetical protein
LVRQIGFSSMTVLSAIQDACAVIPLRQPVSVFGSDDRVSLELQGLANVMGRRIAEHHDWQALKKLATISGDGVTEAFNLPSDFNGMIRDGRLWSSRIQTPYSHVISLDQWLEMEVRDYMSAVGRWTIAGNQILMKPAPVTGETVKYYYNSNLYATDASSMPIAAFANDDDIFRLPEWLLTLGMIWQWRANKGLPYAEDMQNYEEEKERRIAKDKGARLLTVGLERMPVDADYALPFQVTP